MNNNLFFKYNSRRFFISLLIIMYISFLGCSDSVEKRDDLLEVHISEVYGDANAIVTIISDDGFIETAQNLNEIFGNRGLKCTSAGVVEYVNPQLETWKDLLNDGNIDLVNHSYSHVRMDEEKAIAKNKNALSHEIVDSDKWFESTFGNEQIVFVCPENQMCELGYDMLLKNDFWAVRRGFRGYNSLSPKDGIENGNWFNLMVQGICDENVDILVRNSWVDKAINDKLWLIEMWHNVMPEDDGYYQTILISEAEEHLDYISQKSLNNEIWVATFDEAVKYIREKQNINVYAYIEKNELYLTSKYNDKKMSNDTFNQPLTVHIFLPDEYSVDLKKYPSSARGEFVLNVVPGKEYVVQLIGD